MKKKTLAMARKLSINRSNNYALNVTYSKILYQLLDLLPGSFSGLNEQMIIWPLPPTKF